MSSRVCCIKEKPYWYYRVHSVQHYEHSELYSLDVSTVREEPRSYEAYNTTDQCCAPKIKQTIHIKTLVSHRHILNDKSPGGDVLFDVPDLENSALPDNEWNETAQRMWYNNIIIIPTALSVDNVQIRSDPTYFFIGIIIGPVVLFLTV